MAVVNKFNVNKEQVTLDPDIIENMSANDVPYNSSLQYDENTVGDKLSKLESQVIYDVTANNESATFASLSALLSSENLSTLIPTSVRHGGMSIRFVQSSNNKYVQYRLMDSTFSTNKSSWQGVDDEPTVGSDNLVKSGGVVNYCDKKLVPSFVNSFMLKDISCSEKLQSLKLESLINRTISNPEFASQYLKYKATRNDGSIVTLSYQVLGGNISNKIETITITRNGLTISTLINWGEIKCEEVNLNKDVDLSFVYEKTSIINSIESYDEFKALSAAKGRVIHENYININGGSLNSIITSFPNNGFLYEDSTKSHESYNYSDYIDIKNATYLYLNQVRQSTTGILPYVIYDKDKNIVKKPEIASYTGDVNINLTSQIEDNWAYIRCTMYMYEYTSQPSINVTRNIIGLIDRVNQLDEKNLPSIRLIDENDIYRNSNENCLSIENGNFCSIGRNNGTECILFKNNIKAVEFTIGNLVDVNGLAIAFGHGLNNNDVECFALSWIPSVLRTETSATVSNYSFDKNMSIPEDYNHIDGFGHMSSPYRQPENNIYKIATGDRCRIELVQGDFFYASVLKNGRWKKWFTLYTKGEWVRGSQRYGWNEEVLIGFGIWNYAPNGSKNNILTDIRVLYDTNDYLQSKLNKPIYDKKTWLCLGDSITAIDGNNGLSYVGFAKRKYNFDIINIGAGGWTIHKYWRDRSQLSWENAVSSLEDGSVITILMGTNDFDTKSFTKPSSDEQMDSDAYPHPRFGTTNPSSVDAKDPHTTLGCLRLIIERILELKPNCRLVIFSPFYRTKGTITGTGWKDDLIVNSDGKTIYDYADAIVSVGREYNLPSYNTCRECCINSQTLTTFTYDNLHINEEGGKLIGDYVGRRIRNL